MEFESNVIRILTNVLGEPRKSYTSSGGWIEYNCPCCSDELGHPDGKYNFAVTTEELYGHCWKCGYSGKLSRVIRKYGSREDLADYKFELNSLKESRLYQFMGGSIDSVDELDQVEEISLPPGFQLVSQRLDAKKLGLNGENKATRYLQDRGVDEYLIRKFNIGFISYGGGNYSHRIVIPSYDAYGDLNYWVARDYTGNTKRIKILNPDIDKKSIIFNEYYINWYEPITLVEGPFDHIVVPNSIPLLGKSLKEDSLVYKTLVSKAHSVVNIMLDADAVDDAYRMYKFLNSVMYDRVRLIKCPDGYDASDYYRDYGKRGIVNLLRSAEKLDDFTLAMIN